jgi:hypothetical protein
MKMKASVLLLISLVVGSISRADQTKTDVVERLNSSTTTLHQILAAPDKGIPDEVSRVLSASPWYLV